MVGGNRLWSDPKVWLGYQGISVYDLSIGECGHGYPYLVNTLSFHILSA